MKHLIILLFSASIDSTFVDNGFTTIKGYISAFNILFYIIIGVIILGYIIEKIFGIKKMFDNMNSLWGKDKEFDHLDNYKTIIKYLNANNSDMFIISCSYMKNHSRIPKEIQKTLSKIIMKEGRFKDQSWITTEIRSIALHFLCSSFVKNDYIYKKSEPLYIKDITCPRIDSFINGSK